MKKYWKMILGFVAAILAALGAAFVFYYTKVRVVKKVDSPLPFTVDEKTNTVFVVENGETVKLPIQKDIPVKDIIAVSYSDEQILNVEIKHETVDRRKPSGDGGAMSSLGL